jgi:PKD repeat protein
MMKRSIPILLLVGALALGILVVPGRAAAAAPANDNFTDALVIPAIPFADALTIDEATSETNEPNACGAPVQTVWYVFTSAADQTLHLTTNAAFYDFAVVWAQTSAGVGGLSYVACHSPWDDSVTFDVRADQTYYIQAGSSFFWSSGDFGISLTRVPPPSNDDFLNASVINALPYTSSLENLSATIQAGEPVPSCGYGGQPPVGSIWYRYTPAADGWLSASTVGSSPITVFAAYTGSSLDGLVEKGCRPGGANLLTLTVRGGETYYFYVGSLFGAKGAITFNLGMAPDPVAGFAFRPSDPSTFDTIEFIDVSDDPGQIGLKTPLWSFGDGTTTNASSTTHRYLQDGDYQVALTVTTLDGRTNKQTQTVGVHTHDIAILSFATPDKAQTGKASTIEVGVGNTRYPETVQVDLYRSTPNGFQQVGTLTNAVKVMGKKKSVPFTFSYVFTNDDLSMGKVSFQAVATIQGNRDALPSDNSAISLPTRVNR